MNGSLRMHFDAAPDAAALGAARVRWRDAHHRAGRSGAPGRPFLVVTPLGMAMRHTLEARCAALGITIATRRRLPDWPAISTAVYARTDDDERLTVALAFEHIWRAVTVAVTAERWDLASLDDLVRLAHAKKQIHADVGFVRILLDLPGVTLRSPAKDVRLRTIHVPDPDAYELESRLIDTIEA